MLAEGVNTVEIKSGYGLDTETELKVLRVAGKLASEYPVTICRTFLGAHALPPEYKNRPDDYIDLVCNEMLPAIARENLAEAVDVFCEHIAFSTAQTEKVFKTAQALGFAVKLHAEQLSDSGGTELAVKYNALSVDHLEYLGDQGMAALAQSDTVATLLPGAFYCLRETQRPPVDSLRKAGIPMAIATDLNPGTSPFASIRLMMHMACTLFRLTPAEALAGCTRHAAGALGLQHKTGMIKAGLAASMVLWPVAHPAALAAEQTGTKPAATLHNGQITHNVMPLINMDTSLWTGRTDQEANPELAQRWHQKIQGWNPETSSGGIAILGLACDEGVKRNKGRPGAAKGPDSLRKALAPLPWNRQQPAWDAGTVNCQNGELELAQSVYADRLTQLLENNSLPIGFGGGHDIAWASYLGLIRYLEKHSEDKPVKLGIINFDAHFDLRLPENGPSSGTPFWQMAEYARTHRHPYHYMCLGVSHSSNTQALFQRADDLGVIYHTDQSLNLLNLEALRKELHEYIDSVDHIYLTIDMDAFPASQVPGVSAPAARGIPLEVVEPLLAEIKASGKLRLFDLAELNPQYDIDQRSAKVAARLVHLLTSD